VTYQSRSQHVTQVEGHIEMARWHDVAQVCIKDVFVVQIFTKVWKLKCADNECRHNAVSSVDGRVAERRTQNHIA